MSLDIIHVGRRELLAGHHRRDNIRHDNMNQSRNFTSLLNPSYLQNAQQNPASANAAAAASAASAAAAAAVSAAISNGTQPNVNVNMNSTQSRKRETEGMSCLRISPLPLFLY